MTPRSLFHRLLRRVGERVLLQKNAVQYEFYALIQPVRDRNKQYLEERSDPFGNSDGGHLLYYGPTEGGGEQVRAGDTLQVGGKTYFVRRCEDYRMSGKTLYRWGVVQLTGEEGQNEHIGRI